MNDDWYDESQGGSEDGRPAWVHEILLKIRTGILLPWPDASAEFWENLSDAILLATHDKTVAAAAVKRLGISPPGFTADVIKHLKLHIGDLCRERDGGQAPPDSREHAEERSKSCLDCFGQGMTYRFRHKFDPATEAETVSCFCMCPMGRWILAAMQKSDAHHASRIVDLAKYRWLQITECDWSEVPDNKFRHRPEHWDDRTNQPKATQYRPWDRKQLARQTAEAIASQSEEAAAVEPEPLRVPTQPRTPQVQTSFVLSPTQELLMSSLGDHWRDVLMSLPDRDRFAVLALAEREYSNAILIAAINALRSTTARKSA